MKAIIVGDLHIGRGLSQGIPGDLNKLNSRIQDQIDLLDFILDQCLKHDDCKDLILTGDVYHDNKPHPAIIAILMQWVIKCKQNNINVHIIFGNHDIIRSGQYVTSALDLVDVLEIPNSNVYKTITRLDIGDFTFVFCPFKDKRMYQVKTSEEALNALYGELQTVCQDPSDKIKIAVGHLTLDGSLNINDEIVDQLNELYVPPEMFEWFDYVWMGHIHHPHVIQNQKPYVAHVGSLDRSDFSKTEMGCNKIIILLDSESENKFTEISLPNRDLLPITISVPEDKDSTEFVINELCLLSKKINFKRAIIRLNIELTTAELENVNRDKIKSYILENLEGHYVCDFSESRVVSVINIAPEDMFDNTMEVKHTISKWAEKQEFESEEDKAAFLVAADEIRAEFEEKSSK